jgi:putative polyhydroxyalkanoate system protein
MPTISIKRRHTLAHAEAKAAADKIARDLKKRFELAYEWDRDDVSFERAGLSGNMHVGKNDVRLDVQLSLLLTPLKGPIEREIQKQLDELFGKG